MSDAGSPGDAPTDATNATAPPSTPATTAPSRLGRTLYAGILAYMAIDGFRSNDKRVAVAEEKGVPMPDVLVPFVTGMLFVANLGVLLWKFPRASAGALVVFFLSTTPAIHDFWTMEGEERHANKINFCKNVALLGGAIVLLDAAADAEE
ncbi:DoxX family protein [Halobaculum sp. CBA1158]|uniref:DoxX family protein n=1 Tax=Halobaculum sp. CBA1158 TaxID=2904243 RepID=UPI001F2802F5|nr:DoxX family protein [Halobaculum sp. CBA1158]UIO99945.1 DoxX family protein [Halobaculum sp. CBA1158]